MPENPAPRVVRSVEDIERVYDAAQKAAYTAQDAGDTDDYAEALYGFTGWLLGYDNTDPVDAYLSPIEDED